MRSIRQPEEVEQALSRAEAERCAWLSYATDDPAVIELLMLECNPAAPRSKRLAASFALEWFDPKVELPRLPADDDEPEVVKLLKVALVSGQMQTRIAAGDHLAELLAPATIGGR